MLSSITSQCNRDTKKIIVHIFPRSIFFRAYLNFISENYDVSEHVFVVYGSDQHPSGESIEDINKFKIISLDDGNRKLISFISSLFKHDFISILNRSSVVIFHSISDYSLLIILFHLNIVKKSIWLVWGYDISDYLYRSDSYLKRIRVIVKRLLVRNIPYVILRVPEYPLLQERYNSNAIRLPVNNYYPGLVAHPYATATKCDVECQKNHPINILVGNSATPVARHCDVLNILEKFKSEYIHLYLPLSYGGPKEYAREVAERAQAMFGDKVTILDSFMDLDNYNDLLLNMDIGIFHHSRQAALGNIIFMLSAGKKVYIGEKYMGAYTANWNILKEYGYSFESVESISTMNFAEFISCDIDTVNNNKDVWKKMFSNESAVHEWNAVFSVSKNNSLNK